MHATRLGGLLAASLLIAASLLHPSFAQTPSQPDPALNDKAIAMLRSTTDVAQHRQAFAMLEEAEKAGDLRARANLGLGYLLGVGTPRDPMQGGRLLRSAAEAGDPFAALAVATTLAGGNGSLFLHDSAAACRMLEALFRGPAAPEAQYRYFELCSSDPNLQQSFALLEQACHASAQRRHRVALYACGDPKSGSINSLKKYKAAIDRAIGLKPWQQGSAYEASYMPLFFSDRDEFLVYTIRLLDHNGPAWKFDVQKYLEERGIVLANW